MTNKNNKVMKANEAPKKLYVNIYDHLTQKGYYAFTNKVTEDDTEYVRKDAFIEKACSILKDISCPFEIIEQFKNRIR